MMKLMSDAYIVAQGATIWQYLGMKEKQALSQRSARTFCERGPQGYGRHSQTDMSRCHAAFAHNTTCHYKTASVIYSANPDGLCLKASRYLPLAQFGFEFGFRFLFPLS